MARQIQQISGRLGSGSAQTVDLGPTGQFGFSKTSGTNCIFETLPNYSGAAATRVGILSCWFYIEATNSDTSLFCRYQNQFLGTYNSIGLFSSRANFFLSNRGASTTTVLSVLADVGTAVSTDAWHHYLISWDLSSGNSFANDVHVYIDDVDVKPASATTFRTDLDVTWDTPAPFDHTLSFGNTSLVSTAIRLSAIYLNYNEYLDFSVTANRRKFIDADMCPVALGPDGSFPTGSQPLFYFDNPVATIAANRGGAGPFQDVGSLVDLVGPKP